MTVQSEDKNTLYKSKRDKKYAKKENKFYAAMNAWKSWYTVKYFEIKGKFYQYVIQWTK